MKKKRILLKLTGTIFASQTNDNAFSTEAITPIIEQIKELQKTHQFGIVIGGGNIFRGEQHGSKLGLSPSVGHQTGMLATIINGLLLKDLLDQQRIDTTLLSAIVCPQIANPISQDNIDHALKHGRIIIFAGGTGAPFFTNDTNAIVRGLQMEASQVWKGTDVEGIYSADPQTDKQATLIKKMTYSDAISQKLGIMDNTAIALAEKHTLLIRVFNIFTPNALIKAAEDKDFGSTIQ